VASAAGTAVLLGDPANPGRRLLKLTGTSQSDAFVVEPVHGQPRVKVIISPFPRVFIGTFALANFDRIVICALDGHDSIAISAGVFKPVIVHGDAGNDAIVGGSGPDLLFGGRGIDSIAGGLGDDIMHGGDDKDSIAGGPGDDTLYGDGGNDALSGDGGNDIVVGGLGSDKVVGGLGRDILIGGYGVDWLYGGEGDDIEIGGHTPHVNNPAALANIRALWSANVAFNLRLASLAGVINPTTVIDDRVADYVYGNGGRDWLLDYALRDFFPDFSAASGDKKN